MRGLVCAVVQIMMCTSTLLEVWIVLLTDREIGQATMAHTKPTSTLATTS